MHFYIVFNVASGAVGEESNRVGISIWVPACICCSQQSGLDQRRSMVEVAGQKCIQGGMINQRFDQTASATARACPP